MTVDYEKGVFRLAQMASSPPTFPANPVTFNATPIACSKLQTTSGLSQGAKIGIGVGLGVGIPILLIGFAIWVKIKAQRKQTTFWAALVGMLLFCLPKRRNKARNEANGTNKSGATDADDPPFSKTHGEVIGLGKVGNPN